MDVRLVDSNESLPLYHLTPAYDYLYERISSGQLENPWIASCIRSFKLCPRHPLLLWLQ